MADFWGGRLHEMKMVIADKDREGHRRFLRLRGLLANHFGEPGWRLRRGWNRPGHMAAWGPIGDFYTWVLTETGSVWRRLPLCRGCLCRLRFPGSCRRVWGRRQFRRRRRDDCSRRRRRGGSVFREKAIAFSRGVDGRIDFWVRWKMRSYGVMGVLEFWWSSGGCHGIAELVPEIGVSELWSYGGCHRISHRISHRINRISQN